jgi:fructose-1,6-bisphosphatase/inositol monophosphatase family enzyme
VGHNHLVMPSEFAEVESVIRAAADQAIVPRFRSLERSAIIEKSPGDWVTDADHEAEELITHALRRLDPGVQVIGEEASAADPALVTEAGRHDRAWVLDPLDGTNAFIAGSPDFATMVALIEDGQTTAAWIWQPMHGRMFTAALGSGAFADGVRLTRPSPPTAAPNNWRGVLRTRYMPTELRSAALDGFAGSGIGHSEETASGVVYPMAAVGDLTHALYWRTLPWDHAPGTLIAQEAGLVVGRLDGSEYRPWDARYGVLTATDQRVWDVVRGSLPANVADTSTG